ncbi:MAG: choline/ethanolamine kinase family protein [Parvibaculum sp.]
MWGKTNNPKKRAAGLPCWKGRVKPVPLKGGITNVNFLVEDGDRKYVARIGDDMPVHQVMRFNELAAAQAAADAGISPGIVHHEPGALVLDYIESKTLGAADVRDPATLARIVPLLKKCHRDVPKFLRGPALIFWVFHVVRDYGWTLREGKSSHLELLPQFLAAAEELEQAVGPVNIVFGHNDLLPANFLDDGERLWLIDWDYAGFNSPLFDLGGLASNNELSPEQEVWLLEAYFEKSATDDLLYRYQAMKCASLLRETMWSMVSEIHSKIDFDYAAYTAENLSRFNATYKAFKEA